MKKNICVKQHDITDCGAACLASIAINYKLKLPISRIRQYASTDKKGTNVLGMIEAAEKIGFTAKGVRGPFASLHKIPKPAIAHLIIKNMYHHYVIIYKVNKKHVIIMDPGDGRIHKKTYEEFKKDWTGVLIIIMPSENFIPGDHTQSLWKRFTFLLKPHKSVMKQALIGAAIYSLLGLFTSFYVQKIVDYVLVDGNLNLLNMMSIAMIFFLLMKVFINIVKSMLALKTGQKIDATLILGYYMHLLTLPQRFFDTMRVGEIISRINDAFKIRIFINNVSLDIIVNLLIVFFTLCIMFLFSWQLALVVSIGLPLYIFNYYIFNKLNKKYQRKIMENAAELETHLVESLNSVSTIKHFGIEDYANTKTEIRFIRLLKTTFQSAKNSILSLSATEFLAGGLTIAVLWIGSNKVVNGHFTPGTLLSFYSLLGYLINPLTKVISSNQTIQDALIAADRLFQIMDIEIEECNPNKIDLTREMTGDICFKNVSFRYGSRVQVFDDLNLSLQKGKMTAIIGESGSGKTSLISILQNIYPIQSGSIMIGDYGLEHISNSSLRSLFGVVPQKIELFAGSILENIALGETEPDMKKVIDICNMLKIKDFIEKLPAGYQTYVGEHGVSLSGGEKQRISIARAFYKEPEILVLDEATSSLDSASEENVKNAVELMKGKGKTIIVIAHRLSTVMSADRIIVIKNGKVIESGKHDELLDRKGEYYSMWRKQIPIFKNINLFQETC